ncbi:MAG: asparaginase [Oscillospiraceae bacterium]|nr:asparaginase [Oscillospiraceae bacterium]
MRRLLIIGTGGTISCGKTENGLAPAFGITELLAAAGLDGRADIVSEQLFGLDSTNMTPRHWEKLARRIVQRYDEFDGFVITHGTDTMAYAAASLSCLIQNSRKPIVFTGSMKPMTDEDSDAPKNLRDAVKFAVDERAFGVRVVFCGEIIDGRCAHKWDTDTVDPYESVNNEDYGYFWHDGKIAFGEEYSGETRFYEHLSDDVFLIKLIPGQGLYVPENTKALILESYGSGGVPDYLLDEVTKLAGKGVYVIIATQCPYGGTHLNEYEVGQYAARVCPLLETGKMTVEYAVARARWALAYSDNFEDFKRLFNDG